MLDSMLYSALRGLMAPSKGVKARLRHQVDDLVDTLLKSKKMLSGRQLWRLILDEFNSIDGIKHGITNIFGVK